MLRRLLALVLAVLVLAPPVVGATQDGERQQAWEWPQQQWLRLTQAPPAEVAPRGTAPREAPEGPLAVVVRAGPRSTGAVALTFDDGYDIEVCERIATALRLHDATGTFFVNGMHLLARPERWQRILEGMAVGNHTRSHPNLKLEAHPVIRRQILHNEAIHEHVLGRPMLKLLRPPYGVYSDRIRRIAEELDYRIVMWSVDTEDWKPSSSARRIVRRAIGAPSGSIILMHCSRNATARAMPRIIRHYQRRGIELVGLEQVIGP